MAEQVMTVTPPPPAHVDTSNSPFRGQVEAALGDILATTPFFGGGQAPQQVPQQVQVPVQQVPQQVQVPVQQVPQQVQVPVQQVPEQPQQVQQVVSTGPVDLNIASRFADPQAQAPQVQQGVELPREVNVQQPEGLDERANHAWQQIRADAKAWKTAALQYKEQLEQAVKDGGAVAQERAQFADELKRRDDRIKELEDNLGRADLTRSAEFRAKFDEPLDHAFLQMAEVLKDASDMTDAHQIEKTVQSLLRADDAEFTRLVSRLPSPAQGSLLDKRREFNRVMAAREQAISEWRTSQKGLQSINEQEQITKRAERQGELARQAIDFVTVQTPADQRMSILSEPTYSQDVESVKEQFRSFMQQADDKAIARAAFSGFLVPVLQRQTAYLMQALEEYRNAYYQQRNLGHPPVSPIRVSTSSVPQTQVQPQQAPIVPGNNFQDTILRTTMATLHGAGY